MSLPSIHASAVLVGRLAVLIRGPSGSGKSRLCLALLQAAQAGHLPFARLVTDDRAQLQAAHGRLLVRPPTAISGLLEIRGSGIVPAGAEAVAAVGWVVDLGAADAVRLPEKEARETVIEGIPLPRLAVADGQEALPLVLALVQTPSSSRSGTHSPP